MHGGSSHLDLFDPKPELEKLAGQILPDSFGDVMTRRKVSKNPLPQYKGVYLYRLVDRVLVK